MGFRFHKRIKLFKGIYLNISKRGISISLGGKGLTYNIDSKGDVKQTISLKGTGISHSSKIGNIKGKKVVKDSE